MLTINKSDLLAATHCTATKDVRFYLKNVLVEVTGIGTVYIVGTDGHTLFVGHVNPVWSDDGPCAAMQLMIPVDTVKTACKGKGEITLSRMGDRWMLGDSVFTPGEGTFPDWRRVAQIINAEPTIAQFNPDLLMQCTKALRVWFGRNDLTPRLHHRGNSAGAMTGPVDNAFCIVMPMRGDAVSDVAPFVPESF